MTRILSPCVPWKSKVIRARQGKGRAVTFGSFLSLLGKRDCLRGISPRLDCKSYMKNYAKQYELEQILTYETENL